MVNGLNGLGAIPVIENARPAGMMSSSPTPVSSGQLANEPVIASANACGACGTVAPDTVIVYVPGVGLLSRTTSSTLRESPAPPVDAGHDAATVYRIDRAESPQGPFTEAGSATSTRWVDVDALAAADPHYYRVGAENAGGGE